MSYKFDSLITVLNKLDGRENITVRSLMDDLEVSERTIHRYIKTLQVAGFPIGYDRVRQSYAFDEGYSLRIPHLTVEETLAFAMARKVMGNLGSGMEKGLNGIEEKLSRKKVDLPKHIILSAEALPAESYKFLGPIHHAISNFQRLEVEYRALYSDEQTTRNIDPYYLFLQDGFWHLRGYCHLREDFRTFALDRIVSMKALKEHFLPRKIEPEDELAGSFGTVVDGEPVEVVLRVDPEIKPLILRKRWHQSQKERGLKDKRLEIRFKVNGLEGIRQWLYRWIPHIEIISPKELRESTVDDLRAALKKNA